jgi:hypothetical protein
MKGRAQSDCGAFKGQTGQGQGLIALLEAIRLIQAELETHRSGRVKNADCTLARIEAIMRETGMIGQWLVHLAAKRLKRMSAAEPAI